MKIVIKIALNLIILTFLLSCSTVSKKVDEAVTKEEQTLNQLIGKTEKELIQKFGRPDKIDFRDSRNRFYVYVSEKLKIKCERIFEVNSRNIIEGYTSKNCF